MAQQQKRIQKKNSRFFWCLRSLDNWIRKIGFKFLEESNQQFLVERFFIKIKRTKFLGKYNKIKKFLKYKLVFLDET